MEPPFYIHLKSPKNLDKTEFTIQLPVPLVLPVYGHLLMGLSKFEYIDDTSEQNTERAIFYLAIPKYCPKKSKPPLPTNSSQPGPSPRPISSDSIEWIRSYVEYNNTCYTPSTYAKSLNKEIASKLPTEVDKNKCKIWYNPIVNRFEVKIDGDEPTPPELRATLILFSPLSRYLGFTESAAPNASFTFVSRGTGPCVTMFSED